MLLDAEPRGNKPVVSREAPIVLSGQNVTIDYTIPGGFLSKSSKFRAVDGVNVNLHQGQTIGIVGESGSGKSTLGRALLRLIQADGRIFFGKQEITGLDRKAMRPLRRHLQLVFQDPYGSLSPRQTVGEIITEGLFVHDRDLNRAERDRRAIEALKEVGLDPAARNRYPHEFSGGNANVSPLPAPLFSNQRSSFLTNPRRRWTGPFRARLSTSCVIYRRPTAFPTSSSATTCPSSRPFQITSSS